MASLTAAPGGLRTRSARMAAWALALAACLPLQVGAVCRRRANSSLCLGDKIVWEAAAQNPFHAVEVRGLAAPALADVDRDGLLDAVVGDATGRLSFFKGRPDGTFSCLEGAGQNPFNAVKVIGSAVPALADVDGDGLLDAVVGDVTGRLSFFKGRPNGTFSRLAGAGQNPFHDVKVPSFAAPAVADVDGDGLLDAVVGASTGRLFFFKGRPDGTFSQLVGAGQNPFHAVHVVGGAAPTLGDIDGDGRLDALIGDFRGALTLASRHCLTSCGGSARGICSPTTLRCLCLPGFGTPQTFCHGCLPGHFGAACRACPGYTGRHACSRQGYCHDYTHAHAHGLSSGINQFGNGTCQCNAGFYGAGCSKGGCEMGRERVVDVATDLFTCRDCGENTIAADAGSSSCTPCLFGYVPNGAKSRCVLQPAIIAAIALLGVLAAAWCVWQCARRRHKKYMVKVMKTKDLEVLRHAIKKGTRLRVSKVILLEAKSALTRLENKYVDFGHILDVIKENDLKLVKGTWLSAQSSSWRFKRQQDLPSEAFWTFEDLEEQQRLVLFVAVSYCWLHPAHSDPNGEHFRTLAHAIKLRLQMKGPGHVEDIAIFLDYCSLPQQGFNEESMEKVYDMDLAQKESFQRGLKLVNIFYANQMVEVWMVKWVPETETRKYMQRGWPYFEQAVAGLIKDNVKLVEVEHTVVDESDWVEVFTKGAGGRRVPLTPEKFNEEIDKRTFTNGKTDADLVKGKYKETFVEVVGHATALWFGMLEWTDSDAIGLAHTLPHTTELKSIFLTDNKFTAEGALLLIKAAKNCPNLQVMNLIGNPIEPDREMELRRQWANAGKKENGLRMGHRTAEAEATRADKAPRLLGNVTGAHGLAVSKTRIGKDLAAGDEDNV